MGYPQNPVKFRTLALMGSSKSRGLSLEESWEVVIMPRPKSYFQGLQTVE